MRRIARTSGRRLVVVGSLASAKTAMAASALNTKQTLLSRAQPKLQAAAKSFPGFDIIIDAHQQVLERLTPALNLRKVQTKHSDTEGVLLLSSLEPGKACNFFQSYRGDNLPAMTQAFSTFVAGDGSQRVYSKTGLCTPDDWVTPNFDIEVGWGTKPDDLIFYASISTKLALSSHLDYLDRYWNKPPPGGETGLRSFKQLEAEATQTPAYTRFVSPSLWVRAMAVGGLCFRVKHDGGNADVLRTVVQHMLDITDIWLAHMQHDAGGGGGAAAQQGDAVLQECLHASKLLRNYVRYDPMTPLLYPVFGEPAVEKWIETMAGEPPVA